LQASFARNGQPCRGDRHRWNVRGRL